MPRTARASVGGIWYHALNRGNRRETVFHKPGDYDAFVQAMTDAGARLVSRGPAGVVELPVMRAIRSCGEMRRSAISGGSNGLTSRSRPPISNGCGTLFPEVDRTEASPGPKKSQSASGWNRVCVRKAVRARSGLNRAMSPFIFFCVPLYFLHTPSTFGWSPSERGTR